MVKHIVMWTLREEAEGKNKQENVALLKKKLEALPAEIPNILRFEVGLNFNPGDAAYDVVLISAFKNRDALNAYQNHPKHVEVAEFVSLVRDKRAVVDFDV